ncbi:L-threonine 3-dehydrogenase [Diplonema papillatum]|nr:L-threonine 3-dehydrogenase [Diplonema papillatum]
MARAMVFHGVGKPHEMREIPLPELAEGEVLAKVLIATICGSDVHTVSGARKEATPSVLGHEGVGEVVETRRGGVEVGQRVTWTVADACGACRRCAAYKLPQKCERLFKYGHALVSCGSGLNGTFASHVLLRPGTHVVPVPARVSDKAAAALNCAFATVCFACEAARPALEAMAGHPRVVVQGAGLLGIFACALLSAEYPGARIWLADVDPARLSLSGAFGATAVLVADLPGVVESSSVEVVLEFAGHVSCVEQAVALCREGGVIVLAGLVHPDSALRGVTGEQIVRKCLTIVGRHNYAPRHLDEAVAFVASNWDRFPFDRLFSPTTVPLAKLDDAFDLAKQRTYHRVCVACQE